MAKVVIEKTRCDFCGNESESAFTEHVARIPVRYAQDGTPSVRFDVEIRPYIWMGPSSPDVCRNCVNEHIEIICEKLKIAVSK